MSKTITAHVRKGVTVVRDGKRVRPEIGKNFDFTADEHESIKNADAGALGPALDTNTKGAASAASTTDETTGKPTTGKRGKAAAKPEPAAEQTDETEQTGKTGSTDDDL